MEPRIEQLTGKKLLGIRMTMSLADNKTGDLWQRFLPRRKEITNNVTNDLVSMAIYTPTYFADFHPSNEFEKWAAVEVSDFDTAPDGMESFVLTDGLYAVFHYRGSSIDTTIFQYIFGTWLPHSDYVLDTRPHFEILGEKYKNMDPNSEEDIWIPVKQKDHA